MTPIVETARGGAVVTGAGAGVGQAIALRLLRDGFGVAVCDVNPDAVERTIGMAADEGLHATVAAVADVAVEADVQTAVDAARREFSTLSVMVNNAGIGGAFGPITELVPNDWDATFAVLVKGVLLGTKHAARAFLEQHEPGVIVNIASAAGYTAGLAAHAYSAAKAAVISLTRSAALELAPHRIRVAAVSPGLILTGLAGAASEDYARRLDTAQPWPGHGTSDDVAGVVSFLVGADAGFITGTSVVVDGGLLTTGPGPDLLASIGLDPAKRRRAGISYGTTGRPTTVHPASDTHRT
jgi:NAD(P)-dependent dehydrogenase (short-subunit alcohol dehydrogenase family)